MSQKPSLAPPTSSPGAPLTFKASEKAVYEVGAIAASFGFFGMGTCLYLASQGAAKVGGPVQAGTARLLLVALGGWCLVSIDAPAWTLFALVAAAMTVFGLGVAASVHFSRWGK